MIMITAQLYVLLCKEGAEHIIGEEASNIDIRFTLGPLHEGPGQTLSRTLWPILSFT
jgi:hypothetical protein